MRLFRIAISALAAAACAEDASVVSYGSAVILQHPLTKTRCYSAKVNWGFGSRQQVVTGFPAEDYDVNYFWHVKPANSPTTVRSLTPVDAGGTSDDSKYFAGSPVRCNDIIRLEHAETGKNLHSNADVRSPVTQAASEVSCFGQNGVGDDNDNWQLVCGAASSKAGYWLVDKEVSFKHVKSNAYLSSKRGAVYNQSNCPRCHVVGHFEVHASRDGKALTEASSWKASRALILERFDDDDEEDKNPKDEL